MNKLKRVLDDINDKAFVWTVLLYKSEYFYNTLKLCFKFPIIISSSVMSIINSNFNDNNETLKIINISFNVLTAMVLSIGSTLQIEQKEQEFKTNKNKFLKLISVIEQKKVSDDDIDSIFVNNIIEQYNLIEGNIDFEIPAWIRNNVHNQYKEKKTLPSICNGVKKKEQERSKSITMDDIEIPKLESSIIYNNKSPRVLSVKQVIDCVNECV